MQCIDLISSDDSDDVDQPRKKKTKQKKQKCPVKRKQQEVREEATAVLGDIGRQKKQTGGHGDCATVAIQMMIPDLVDLRMKTSKHASADPDIRSVLLTRQGMFNDFFGWAIMEDRRAPAWPPSDRVEWYLNHGIGASRKWWGIAELVLAQDLLWKSDVLPHDIRLVVVEAGELTEGHTVTLQAVQVIQRREGTTRARVGPIKWLVASDVTHHDLVLLHEPGHYSATVSSPSCDDGR